MSLCMTCPSSHSGWLFPRLTGLVLLRLTGLVLLGFHVRISFSHLLCFASETADVLL